MFKSPTQTGPEAESYDRLSRYEGASPCQLCGEECNNSIHEAGVTDFTLDTPYIVRVRGFYKLESLCSEVESLKSVRSARRRSIRGTYSLCCREVPGRLQCAASGN